MPLPLCVNLDLELPMLVLAREIGLFIPIVRRLGLGNKTGCFPDDGWFNVRWVVLTSTARCLPYCVKRPLFKTEMKLGPRISGNVTTSV